MSNITKIEWIKNHKQEIEFTNSWGSDKYILYLKNGDVSAFYLAYQIIYNEVHKKLYLPVSRNIPLDFIRQQDECNYVDIITLDDIAPDFSPYIDKESAVLFLNQESFDKLRINYDASKCFIYDKIDGLISDCLKTFKFITLITSELHSENLEEINNICKELKEKYEIDRVEVVTTHCFLNQDYITGYVDNVEYHENGDYKAIHMKLSQIRFDLIDKLITTNSTSILEPQNSERLQVIDCIEFFKGL